MPKYLMLIVESEAATTRTPPRPTSTHVDAGARRRSPGRSRSSVARTSAARRCSRSPTATYLRGTRTDDVTVVDNPAPDLKEVLGGYYLDRGRRRRPRPQDRRALPGAARLHRDASDLGDPRHGWPEPARRRPGGRRRPAAVLGPRARAPRCAWRGDLDIAEEATADAFVLALQTWPERGVPDSVEAWLLTAARRRAIDRIRRLGRFRQRLAMIAATGDLTAGAADAGDRRAAGARRRAAPRRAVLPPGARHRDPGRPDDAPRLRRADGVDRRRLPRARADDGRPPDPGQEAHRRFRDRHRAARRPGRRGAHAGGPPDDPPRLRHGPHRRFGPRAAQRRRHRPRPAPRPRSCTACVPTTPRPSACWR